MNNKRTTTRLGGAWVWMNNKRTTTSIVAVAIGMAACTAMAFNATAWEAKNGAMAKEASRMKAEYAVYEAKSVKPAKDVTIPLETFDSGEIKILIVAKQGQFFHDVGYTWAKDLVVKRFKDDGSVDMWLDAEKCLIDRPHKCCWISGHVKAFHRKTTLEGVDAFYCTSNNFLKVMSHAKVVSEDVKMKGLKL